jgi:hypothetical protein
MRRLLTLVSCLALLVPPAVAQQPAAPAAITRLQQMESIYQKELSARHIPLLGKYLVELQRQAATATDKTAYEAEIARIQQVISAGGVLDLIAMQQSQSGAMPMPAPPPAPVPIERKQALIALSPALAQTVSPTPAANAETATIGEADWRIELIAAGTYDILLHYACPELAGPLKIRVEFNGPNGRKGAGRRPHATKDCQTFRILRLGSLTLTGDHRGETLRLSAGDKTSPKLILKSLLITPRRDLPPPIPSFHAFHASLSSSSPSSPSARCPAASASRTSCAVSRSKAASRPNQHHRPSLPNPSAHPRAGGHRKEAAGLRHARSRRTGAGRSQSARL